MERSSKFAEFSTAMFSHGNQCGGAWKYGSLSVDLPWGSWIMPRTFARMWVKQCVMNQPPVITMFIGGM